MARREFSKEVRRAAKERSGGLCEAIGTWYGLEPGKRCNAPLDKGVEYDHFILDHNSKDNSLANCRAVCISCHDFKTRKHDIPLAAKTKRQADMRYVTKPKGSIARPPKPPRQSTKLPIRGDTELQRRIVRAGE